MKICIVAGGLATRLQPLTNYIPKFLVNIGKQTGFVEMIRYWSTYSKDFTIIIHPKYEKLTRAYFDLYFKDTELTLTIKTCETALGTAHTIDTSLGDEYDDHDILFTWCDVIPSEPIDIDALEMSAIHGDGISVFTVNNELNRYKVQDNKLFKSDDGNVVGIYYIEDYRNYIDYDNYVEGDDFADVLAKNFINEFPIANVIDFGDKPKLFEVLKKSDGAREFNAVEIGDKFVHKYSLNPQGDVLIKREIEWYKTLANSGASVKVPTIYPSLDNLEMVMSKVEGVPVYKIFNESAQSCKEQILQNIFDGLSTIHSIGTYIIYDPNFVHDCIKQEACDKLIARYTEIKDVINSFGENIDTVNGIKIDDPVVTIFKLYNEISTHYQGLNTLSLIHGDSQLSNTMINPETFEITFIDPRGYFGQSLLYGLPDYDIAKVLYSISGYDAFNYSTNFHIDHIGENEITFTMPTVEDAEYLSSKTNLFKPIHWLWLAVIWIGLAGYIRNNPVKSLAAHYHGLSLATRFLNKDFTI